MAAALTTYAEWYNLPENDPFHGDFSTLFPVYALPGGAGTTDIRITNSITCGVDSKTTFIFLAQDGSLHLLHRVRRFVPALGAPIAAYDNCDFATFDETTPTGPSTVEVPAGFFHAVPAAITVLTAAAIDLQIAADPAANQYTLDPLTAAARLVAGDTAAVRVRKAMAVPPDIASAVLTAIASSNGLNPRTLWLNFVTPLLLDPVRSQICAPFIEWARVAYADDAGPTNTLALPIPPPRHLEPSLGIERRRILTGDFPHLTGPPPQQLGPLVAELALTRREAADRDTLRRLVDQQTKAAAALPSKRWGAGLSRLLRLCQIATEGDLPPVWTEMAQHGVKADITTIRAHLHTPQPDLGPGGVTSPPVCTTEMAKALGRLEFQTHRDAIETGIHVFGICHPTQDSITKANELAGLFAEQILGVTGISITESVALKKAQDLLLPVSLLELKHVLFGYHRFLAVILGSTHPVVAALGSLTHRLQANEMTYHLFFLNKVSLCACLLRFVQLRMHRWIEDQLSSDLIIPPPVFLTALDDIALDCWTPPSLPCAYLAKPPPPTRPSYATIAASTTTPLLAITSLGTPATHPADAYFDVAPHLRDPTVKELRAFVTRTFIRSHGPPPNNNTGGPMCLNFHVRHRCRFDCDRMGDHRRHTPAETVLLNTYLNSATLSPAPATVAVVATPN